MKGGLGRHGTNKTCLFSSMDQKISTFFPFNSDTVSEGLQLCLSKTGSGDFSFLYLLMKQLKQVTNVTTYKASTSANISSNNISGPICPLVLITTTRSRAHYEAIFRKNVSTDIVNSRATLCYHMTLLFNRLWT
jgi:hypothetical protein